MTTRSPEPQDNRERILADLRPVRPLRPSWLRVTSLLFPWVAGLLAILSLAIGLRPDIAEVGLLGAWGISALFLLSAGLLATFAVKESVPAAGLPRLYTLGFAAVVLTAQIVLAAILHTVRPLPVVEGESLRLAFVCSTCIACVALTWTVLMACLLARGLLLRPASTVLLSGAAGVVAAEAIWRLHCPYTSPLHLVTAHFPPYLLALLGAIVALVIGAGRRSRARGEPPPQE